MSLPSWTYTDGKGHYLLRLHRASKYRVEARAHRSASPAKVDLDDDPSRSSLEYDFLQTLAR